MRKGHLFSTCGIALLAFFGMTAVTVGYTYTDQDCNPYGNEFGLYDVDINTSTSAPHAVSGVTGSGLACGTELESGSLGWETLFDNADIVNPKSVEVASTASLPLGSYVGEANIDAASYFAGLPVGAPGQTARLRIDDISACEAENDAAVGGPVPGEVVACYLGDTTGLLAGHNWNWVTQGPGWGTTLTIGPFYNDMTFEPAGLTQINEFSLCQYAEDDSTTGTKCGTSGGDDPWLQKNGHKSKPGCENGEGIYTATATNKAGQTTDPLEVCVDWGRSLDLAFAPPSKVSAGADLRVGEVGMVGGLHSDW